MRPERQRRELLHHRRRVGEAEHEVRAGLAETRPGGTDGGKSKGVKVMLMVAAVKEQEGGN
jgi:hypothetical protein